MSMVMTKIRTLGTPEFPSPLHGQHFLDEGVGILVDPLMRAGASSASDTDPACFDLAGPRKLIFFDPSRVGAAIVTCGGLCPGLNDVIRSAVLALWHGYGVRRIWGIRNGYRGFVDDRHPPMPLDPEVVKDIHNLGGTMLGSSRGPQPASAIADTLTDLDINLLFCVGGDGTLRGALTIEEELRKRNQPCAVIGIPKTIDNDISLCARSFGFETAVEEARKAIAAAHVEAISYPGGIGLVRLMGRHSGFIAATATLAQPDVNACLIPEVDFDVDGPHGLLAFLEARIRTRSHAVVVVAEGAGQKYVSGGDQQAERAASPGERSRVGAIHSRPGPDQQAERAASPGERSRVGAIHSRPGPDQQDASGNTKLGDIGVYLTNRIKAHFKDNDLPMSLKYIDPSYIIRSVAANADDSVFCNFLANNAVHEGMAGKTGFMVSIWNNQYVNVPIAAAADRRKQIDPSGRLWGHVLQSTGQPSFLPE